MQTNLAYLFILFIENIKAFHQLLIREEEGWLWDITNLFTLLGHVFTVEKQNTNPID